MIKRIVLGGLLALVLTLTSKAQFYNGHQMSFGKNRVQYNDFYWQYFRFEKFDTYFYVSGDRLAAYVSRMAFEEIERAEFDLEEVLQSRLVFIIYNKQSEFYQSNIGLVSGSEENNIGGVTRIINNKVFLFYEGDHKALRRQMRASIAEILLNQMLYGGNFRNRMTNSAVLNFPEWYLNGLTSFLAYDDDLEAEEAIRKGMLSGKFQKIHRLNGEKAKYAGHAFWRYINEIYGSSVVSQIIYMTRLNKNIESGFMYVLGASMKDLVSDCFYYYQARYQDELTLFEQVEEPMSNPLVKRASKKSRYTNIALSPEGNYAAMVKNTEGRKKIILQDNTTGKKKVLLAKGQKLQQIQDYSYPLLAWHPLGGILTYIYEDKGHIWMEYYTLETKEYLRREVFYLDKVLDYCFSPNGTEIAFSAVENGYSDIYIFNVAAGTYRKITNDLADDFHPRYTSNGKELLFSSNRRIEEVSADTSLLLQLSPSFDIFSYSFKDEQLNKLTQTYFANEYKPVEVKKDEYLFMTDYSGIMNLGSVRNDSAISLIDTSIHYRYFTLSNQLSNFKYSLKDYSTAKYEQNTAYSQLGLKRPQLKSTPLASFSEVDPVETWFKNHLEEKHQFDSVARIYQNQQMEADSILVKKIMQNYDTLVDIDNYVFEFEKEQYQRLLKLQEEKKSFKLPKQLVYFTHFYSNKLVTQVDFSFMNESYQVFTGGQFFFQPGGGVLTKIGAIDLFEDYKLTFGFRFPFNGLTFPPNFEDNEYLLSVENLQKRLDKHYIYHRTVYADQTGTVKVFSNELLGKVSYPYSQVQATHGTLRVRADKLVAKAYNSELLYLPNVFNVWGGAKLEHIFDNTHKLGLNTYDGVRAKIFGEYYTQLGKDLNTHFFVAGFDARFYLPIHRDFVWASRVAGSTSFGNALLIYYLGGVDNWMNLSPTKPIFDQSTNINYDKNWRFQAVATNMRGFIQNTRNGHSFAVANTELRLPVLRYIFNRPLSNDFFNNLMVIGFADMGSAWEGLNPFTAYNAYDVEEINNYPITVIVDRKRSPMVFGYGWGLRSRLFGYYVRADWAWGIDTGVLLPRVFYLSLTTDF
jgi:hypothetical protein